MRHTLTLAAVAAIFLGSIGCTDVRFAQVTAYGNVTKVTCWSGGDIIYDGMSTGRVSSLEGSDGWQFMDASTKKLTEVSGNCVMIVQ